MGLRDETISLCSRIELRGSLLCCGWHEPAAVGGKANYATLQSYTPAVYSTPSRHKLKKGRKANFSMVAPKFAALEALSAGILAEKG